MIKFVPNQGQFTRISVAGSILSSPGFLAVQVNCRSDNRGKSRRFGICRLQIRRFAGLGEESRATTRPTRGRLSRCGARQMRRPSAPPAPPPAWSLPPCHSDPPPPRIPGRAAGGLARGPPAAARLIDGRAVAGPQARAGQPGRRCSQAGRHRYGCNWRRISCGWGRPDLMCRDGWGRGL